MKRIKQVGKASRFGRTLREQNCDRRDIKKGALKGLESFYTTVEKFTIVELVLNEKRYHGLSVKSKDDIWNLTEGIARAYLRAFDDLVEAEGLLPKIGRNPFDQFFNSQPLLQTPDTLAIGMADKVLYAHEICKAQGIYRVKCFKCGKSAEYHIEAIRPDTQCPHCKKKLLSSR